MPKDIRLITIFVSCPGDVEEEKQVKRIASLDFGRGLAIIGMVFFHVFMRMYDYSYLENMTGGMPDIHIALLIFFGILAFFGTWHAFFLFMSSAINTYVTIRRAYRNRNLLNNMFKQIITGLVLLIKYITSTNSSKSVNKNNSPNKINSSNQDSAQLILKQRFAKGEIDKKEYFEKLKVLKNKTKK